MTTAWARRGSKEALAVALCLVLVSLALSVGPAPGDDFKRPGKGPWRAQIVDGETKQLLEGVVVLAIWNERHGSVGGLAGGGYFASEEVLTGADGRFTIGVLKKRLLNPFAILKGPEFYIFKPGYGRWHFQGDEEWPKLDLEEQDKRVEETWRRFNSAEGVVLELPPLKMRGARLKFIASPPTPGMDVPREQMRKLLKAIDDERVALGLDAPRPDPKEQGR